MEENEGGRERERGGGKGEGIELNHNVFSQYASDSPTTFKYPGQGTLVRDESQLSDKSHWWTVHGCNVINCQHKNMN